MRKRVVIINKYGALHPSATGRPIRKLAGFLWENGIDVIVLSIRASYKGQVSCSDERLPYRCIELADFYSGSNKWLRLMGNVLDGFRLVVRSMLLPRHQLKVVLTDPSLINVWALFFRPFYRSHLAFWTMDLYPEAFVSAGLVSRGNLLFRSIAAFVYRREPDLLITLGEQQYHYLCRQYRRLAIPHIILPCGICQIEKTEMPFWRRENMDKIVFCYAGNIGEAHSDVFLQELIRQLDPAKHVLLLRLYGAKAQRIVDTARLNKAVIILDYITSAELQYADISVATLLPVWNHVCVPSKVVSAICLGLPVVYNANEESEGACMFGKAIWLIPDMAGLSASISDFLGTLSSTDIIRKKEAAVDYSRELIRMENDSQQALLKII